jgi:AraC-like DNA-binding protein
LSTSFRPLSRYPILLTEDIELARQKLFEVFGADVFEAAASEQFFVCSNFLRMSRVGLCYAEYGSTAELGFPEATFVRQLFNISGRGQFQSAATSASISQQMLSPVIPDGTRFSFQVGEPYRALVLRIEMQALEKTLTALSGDDVAKQLTFLSDADNASELSASFKRELFFFASEFNGIGQSLSPVAVAELEQSLITKFLIGNRHNYSDLLLSEALLTANSQVKTIEEYIEAHWREPLDIAALAALTNTSVRSLFRQFKKSRDYSPMEFLKLTRLRQARQMLLSGTNDSVLSVMLKCGFQNAGHFARDYRRVFGERPSETLRRGSS